MIPDWLPNIHPLIVHFPIALLVFAVLMNGLTFILPRNWWDEFKTTILYCFGTLCTIGAFYTGNQAVDTIYVVVEAQKILSEHADWAKITTWYFVIYSSIRILLHYIGGLEKKWLQLLMFFLVIPAIYTLHKTGENGTKMVYGFGAGTGQLLEKEQESIDTKESLQDSLTSGFILSENEDWKWTITKNGVDDLRSKFHWIHGDILDLKPTIIGKDILSLSASIEKNEFLSHQTYQNVQLDMYVNLDSLNGEFKIIHHYFANESYDFVSISAEGNVTQGRIKGDESIIFEKSQHSFDGLLFISVVSDGTHFRGYLNEKMIVHGHGEAPNKGYVGIGLTGQGKIYFKSITLTQLY